MLDTDRLGLETETEPINPLPGAGTTDTWDKWMNE